jgi:hypothetical protein
MDTHTPMMSAPARFFVGPSGIPSSGIHKAKVRKLYAKRFARLWQKSEEDSAKSAAYKKPNCHDMCYMVRKFRYGANDIVVDPEKIYIDPMYDAYGRFAHVRLMVDKAGIFVPDGQFSLSELGMDVWVDESVETRVEVVKSGKCAIAFSVTA